MPAGADLRKRQYSPLLRVSPVVAILALSQMGQPTRSPYASISRHPRHRHTGRCSAHQIHRRAASCTDGTEDCGCLCDPGPGRRSGDAGGRLGPMVATPSGVASAVGRRSCVSTGPFGQEFRARLLPGRHARLSAQLRHARRDSIRHSRFATGTHTVPTAPGCDRRPAKSR